MDTLARLLFHRAFVVERNGGFLVPDPRLHRSSGALVDRPVGREVLAARRSRQRKDDAREPTRHLFPPPPHQIQLYRNLPT
jgi:hypothetical protein